MFQTTAVTVCKPLLLKLPQLGALLLGPVWGLFSGPVWGLFSLAQFLFTGAQQP